MATTEDARRVGAARRLLTVLCTAQFMIVLDVSVTNVALASIQDDLGFSPAGLQWIVTAYTLTFGGLLVLAGRVGDLFGRRRMFLLGLGLFALASLACGLAPSAGVLVAARAAQGVGGAMLSPAALSLLTTNFAEGPARTRALGVWGAVAAVGGSAGLILGGTLTSALSWRAVFFVNVPVGLVLLVAGARVLTESREPGDGRRLDWVGAATITGGLFALVLALSSLESPGTDATRVVLPAAAAAVVLLSAFVLVERRVPAPLVPLSLFRTADVGGANLVSLLVAAVVVAQSYFLALYLRDILGYSPVVTGAALLPLTVTVIVTASVLPRFLPRVGTRGVLVAAGLGLAASMLLLARLSVTSSYLDLLPGFLLGGVGLAGTLVAATIAATDGVPADQQGVASGVLNTTQQVGSAVGLAALAGLAAARTAATTGPTPEALTAGFRAAFLAAAVLGVLAAGAAFLIRTPTRSGPVAPPPPAATPFPSGSPAAACVPVATGRR